MDADLLRRWLRIASERVRERRDELTALDSAIGDADHSLNLDRGLQAVVAKLDGLADPTPATVLTTAGSTLMSTVGGASGPLWGTALRRAGKSLGTTAEFDLAALAGAFEAAMQGVVDLGGAQEGDKTMVDALAPAVRALRAAAEVGAEAADALRRAAFAAEEGARATIPLQARKGRASYLGERSVGHQDVGATSTALLFAALAEAARAD